MEFKTTVYLPKLKLDSVLKGFEADLPNTRQVIDFLPDTPFGSFALTGSNAGINLRVRVQIDIACACNLTLPSSLLVALCSTTSSPQCKRGH